VPDGASGSSTISAKLLVPGGASLQVNGGEMFLPSRAYCRGISPPLGNAGLWRANDTADLFLFTLKIFGKQDCPHLPFAGQRSSRTRVPFTVTASRSGHRAGCPSADAGPIAGNLTAPGSFFFDELPCINEGGCHGEQGS